MQERVQRVGYTEMDELRGLIFSSGVLYRGKAESVWIHYQSLVTTRIFRPGGMAKPPPKIRLTLEGVCLMLGHKSVEWEDIRKVGWTVCCHSPHCVFTPVQLRLHVLAVSPSKQLYSYYSWLRVQEPQVSCFWRLHQRSIDIVVCSRYASDYRKCSCMHNCHLRPRLRERLKKTYLNNPLLTLDVSACNASV